MEENIVSPTAIKYAILEALNNAVEQIESSFRITMSDIEIYNKEKDEIEKRLRELTDERNRLLTRIQKIGDEIKELNMKLEKLKQTVSKELMSSNEFRRSVREIIAEYNIATKTIPEEDIKVKYPKLYKFVKVMSKMREFETVEEPMYTVIERGTRTTDALTYYLVTNYKYAQTGSSKRITLTEAAKRYGIRTSTLSATIAKLLKKGIIVKVYDPIT
ncbi:MAG: hypothetical protein DRN17_03455, partial [Thermoplasmata archaeon]